MRGGMRGGMRGMEVDVDDWGVGEWGWRRGRCELKCSALEY